MRSTLRALAVYSLILVGTLLLGVAGCAKRAPEPTTGPGDIPGYTNLKREFGPLDFSPLQGRRIVLDPGHGGYFRGAVGPGGLTEAEVNLGVALYLRGLLEWAGAEVHLTRTADYDFLSPADSSLSSDLAFRVNFANELQPDVFLSIHHNSTASADPVINETQTYYPIGQEGSSLDLARSIHHQLVLNLEISPAKILPGNFHVLREAQVPAVLGEPAMISNPVIEGRLSLAASQDLEARAYFLGLLDYFAGGSPVWQAAQPDTVIQDGQGGPGQLSWTFLPGLDTQGPGPDPSTFHLTRDGVPEPFSLSADGHTVTWRPRGTWPQRPVEFHLSGRNLRNRSTTEAHTLVTPVAGALGQIEILTETGRPGEQDFDLIRWWRDASSRQNLPLGLALVPARRPLASDQVERFFALSGEPAPANFSEAVDAVPEDRSLRLISFADSDEAGVVTEIPPGGWHSRLGQEQPWPPGNAGSPGLAVRPEDPVWLEARGALPVVDPAPANPDTARTVAGSARYWITEKLVPALYGKVIVLDPAGGGTNTDGTGPLGTRGADINLESALRARTLLEGAGAIVHLTRTGEHAPPAQDKIRLADQVAADLFLTVKRSPRPGLTAAAHHPGSVIGQAWAQATAQAAASLCPADAPGSVQVGASWAYLLRHTACPALEAGFPPLSGPVRETQAASPHWQLQEARVILLGAAAAVGETRILEQTLSLTTVLTDLAAATGSRALTPVTWARLDGNFPWQPAEVLPATVQVATDSLSCSQAWGSDGPGFPDLLTRHTLEIHQGPRWQFWLLDYSAGYLEARLLMEGP